MHRNMVRGDEYKGLLQVGQRIYCGLYGGKYGVIYGIEGEQRPDTIRQYGGGLLATGGRAIISVVFDDDTVSKKVPEGVIRGVQWQISDEIATEKEVSDALTLAVAAKIMRDEEKQLEDDRRGEERRSLPEKYPFLIPEGKDPKKRSGIVLGALNLKKELNKAFPGVKFSVKSESYSMGNAIRVYWTDGPTSKHVDEICDKYQQGSYNGMEDIYEYDKNNVFPDVFGGSKSVTTARHESAAAYIYAVRETAERLRVKAPLITVYEDYAGHPSAYIERGDDILFDHHLSSFSSEVNRVFSEIDFRGVPLPSLPCQITRKRQKVDISTPVTKPENESRKVVEE